RLRRDAVLVHSEDLVTEGERRRRVQRGRIGERPYDEVRRRARESVSGGLVTGIRAQEVLRSARVQLERTGAGRLRRPDGESRLVNARVVGTGSSVRTTTKQRCVAASYRHDGSVTNCPRMPVVRLIAGG